MATESNGSSTRPSALLNVPCCFTEEFLAYLAARDEPETGAEAALAASWRVTADPHGGFAVLAEGESLEAGDVPVATFLREELAMIAAAVLPGTARRLRFRLGDDPCERGYPVLFDGAVVGHLRRFDDALVAAMTVVDALLASPCAFGWVLEALGGLAAARIEKVMAARRR